MSFLHLGIPQRITQLIWTSILALPIVRETQAEQFVFDPVPSPRLNPLKLSSRLVSNQVVVSWSGTGILQNAPEMGASWDNVSFSSPFRGANQGSGFFRLISADRPTSIFVPPQYRAGTATALVISLHGFGNDSIAQEKAVPLRALAESVGFLYCVPEGTRNPDGTRYWNGNNACGSTVDDVGYLSAIIAQAQETFSIDSKRIYLVGVSNGGIMAYRMACERADLVAAVASISGAVWGPPIKCAPSSPVHVLEVHGTADGLFSYNGGSTCATRYLGAVAAMEKWASLNGCQSMDMSTDVTLDLDVNLPGLDTSVTRMTNCSSGASAELWTVVGGGHVPVTQSRTAQSELSQAVIEWLFAHAKP